MQDEVSLDHSQGAEFEVNNPRSWSRDSVSHIETTLTVNEVPYDGLVCLFSVRNDATDRDIDYDEVREGNCQARLDQFYSSIPHPIIVQDQISFDTFRHKMVWSETLISCFHLI